MTSIKERIVEYVDFKGIGKEKFFKKIGVSSSNFRGSAMKSEVNGKVIAKILSNFDVDPYWLLTGKGSMFVEGIPNNNPITLRIIDVTLHFNISYNDFCSSIGRDYKNKGNWYYEFTDVELKNIISVYKINPLWLLTGEGEMIDKNNDNELKELRQENSLLKDKIIALLENNTGQNKKINKAG